MLAREQSALPLKIMVAGGTIAMHQTEAGLAVDPNFAKRFAAALVRLAPDLVYELEVLQPALDSASATPEVWLQLATWVRDNEHCASGFLILHGTDTMAYTAAALSHWLAGLEKPVVLTGSQRPLDFADSDAEANIALALRWAQSALAGVRLAFGGQHLHGAAVRKVDSQQFVAFECPNGMRESALLARSRFLLGEPVDLPKQAVASLYLSPAMPQSALAVLSDEAVQGVVVQSYGMGNLPNDADLQSALYAAQARGVVMVNVSQCWRGGVAQDTYAAGAARLGLLSGGMHTPEYVYTLLYVGLGYGLRGEDLRGFVLEQSSLH